MLSDVIPKCITIIVKRGENLEYSVPGSKITPKSRRWLVMFIGGKKKMMTQLVEAQNGCPVWDTEVTIDLVSPTDPVVMRVQDGDDHHIGQVIIPLARIPRSGPPNFDPSKLQYSELEPTKKNNVPRGRLIYWIWATSYWPPGTKLHHKSKGLRGSLANLKRSKSKHHRFHGAASVVGDFDDQNSTFSSDARSSRAPSMVSGAYSESNLSGEAGYMGGGGGAIVGNANGSALWPTVQPSYGSQLNVPGASYNPLPVGDDAASLASGRPSLYQGAGGGSQLGSMVDLKQKKHRGLFKLKRSHSQSHHALNTIARKAGGDKLYGSPASVMSALPPKPRSTFPDTSSTLYNPISNGSIANFTPRDSTIPDQSQRTSFPGNTNALFGQPTATTTTVPTRNDAFASKEPSCESPLSTRGSTSWGLHAEERDKKPLEEMSHRELVNYAMQLERSAQVTRAELARVQGEHEELLKKSACTEKDLDSVRLDLADLRVRLLTAGLTEFLERPTAGSEPVSKGLGKRTMSFSGTHSASRAPAESQSFLDRLTALTANTRKFGGGPPSEAGMSVPPVATSTDWW